MNVSVDDVIKLFTAAGGPSVVVLVLWFQVRELRSRVEEIAQAMECPAVKKRKRLPHGVLLLLALLLLISLLAGSGCAVTRQRVQETIGETNRITVATAFALWPATATVDKQRLSQGKTQSIGVEGTEATGGGTNLVDALKEVRLTVEALSHAVP